MTRTQIMTNCPQYANVIELDEGGYRIFCQTSKGKTLSGSYGDIRDAYCAVQHWTTENNVTTPILHCGANGVNEPIAAAIEKRYPDLSLFLGEQEQ